MLPMLSFPCFDFYCYNAERKQNNDGVKKMNDKELKTRKLIHECKKKKGGKHR